MFLLDTTYYSTISHFVCLEICASGHRCHLRILMMVRLSLCLAGEKRKEYFETFILNFDTNSMNS